MSDRIPALWFPSSSLPSSVWWRSLGLPSIAYLCTAAPGNASLHQTTHTHTLFNFTLWSGHHLLLVKSSVENCVTSWINYIPHFLETFGGFLYKFPVLSGSFLWKRKRKEQKNEMNSASSHCNFALLFYCHASWGETCFSHHFVCSSLPPLAATSPELVWGAETHLININTQTNTWFKSFCWPPKDCSEHISMPVPHWNS